MPCVEGHISILGALLPLLGSVVVTDLTSAIAVLWVIMRASVNPAALTTVSGDREAGVGRKSPAPRAYTAAPAPLRVMP
jgi:hypothetical protein